MTHATSESVNIDCSFGYGDIIGKVTTKVQKGEFVVLTGHNGSGKSTLISTIAGELEPLNGIARVFHDGYNLLIDPAIPAAAGCVTRIAEPSFFQI